MLVEFEIAKYKNKVTINTNQIVSVWDKGTETLIRVAENGGQSIIVGEAYADVITKITQTEVVPV